jgi:hypothetical protein
MRTSRRLPFASSKPIQYMLPNRRVTITARMAVACCDRVVNHGKDRRTRSSLLLMSKRANGQPVTRWPTNASTVKDRIRADSWAAKLWDWSSISDQRTGESRFSAAPPGDAPKTGQRALPTGPAGRRGAQLDRRAHRGGRLRPVSGHTAAEHPAFPLVRDAARARFGPSSTATSSAPARHSSTLNCPVPGPISSTLVPERIPIASTTSPATAGGYARRPAW